MGTEKASHRDEMDASKKQDEKAQTGTDEKSDGQIVKLKDTGRRKDTDKKTDKKIDKKTDRKGETEKIQTEKKTQRN